ncbi:NUDIX domain-containing protein [Ureibacillus sp. FSL E2-3493]|uniref:NUDIX domain-containing protein n=1 Tax=Ureibacillus sp. FSL E2-3493 TaxID=2921367 RepID=UPI00311A04BD
MEIKKAYGYVIRMKEGAPQVLVFQHINLEAGIQIPKGTVNANETPLEGVIREMKEETGLTEFVVDRMVAEDFWENDDGVIHHLLL